MPEFNRRRFLQIAGATAGVAALSGSIARAAAIPAAAPLRNHRRRRAHRRPDAGEPFLRPLLRHAEGRPRLRRPAPGRPWRAASRSGTSRTASKEVLPYHPDADDLGMQFIAGPRPRLGGRPQGLEQRQVRQLDTRQDRRDDGPPDPRGHPVPLRAGRRVHRLRRVPLLVHGRHRPQPLLHVHGPRRQRRQGRRPGPRQRGGRLRLDDLPGAAGEGRGLLEDLPGHRRRPGRGRPAGAGSRTPTAATTATTPCSSSTSTATPSPATRCTTRPAPARTSRRATATSTDLKADVKAGKLPQISWIAAPEAFSEHPNWPANYGAWYISQVLDALTSNPEVWSRTALFVTYDENDGYFDHVPPALPAGLRRPGRVHRRHRARPLPRRRQLRRRPLRPRPARPDARRLPVEHRRLRLLRGLRPHLHHPVHGAPLRRRTSRNISPWRRAICGDLTSAFDFGLQTHQAGAAARHRRLRAAGQRAARQLCAASRPANPVLPKQEQGSRPTRPLPYAPLVDGVRRPPPPGASRSPSAAGDDRPAPASSSPPATAPTAPGRTPRRPARRSPTPGTPSYSKDVYDLTVHGPNGFLRTFKGDGKTAGPEVTARHDATAGRLELTLTNPGTHRLPPHRHQRLRRRTARPSRSAPGHRQEAGRPACQQALVRRVASPPTATAPSCAGSPAMWRTASRASATRRSSRAERADDVRPARRHHHMGHPSSYRRVPCGVGAAGPVPPYPPRQVWCALHHRRRTRRSNGQSVSRSCSQHESRTSGWSRSIPNSSRARRRRYLRVLGCTVSRRAASPTLPAASSQARTDAA